MYPRICKLLLMLVLAGAARQAAAQALSPEQAQKRFKMAEGFEVQLFASEPMVRQPVTMTFDERGRMWVIQYLQYPNPAGLKPVEVDRYLRTKYDQRPAPRPKVRAAPTESRSWKIPTAMAGPIPARILSPA